ncbi:MAG: DUF2171 domain-containing protein [Pirellulaceae bacterium]|nr:DUF2171 domain-containing protein [Pirellulaceae bacterium]
MVKSISENMSNAGAAVAETAKNVGSSIAESAERAVEFVKEKTGMETVDVGVAGIHEHMDVIASCGKKVGVVDDVEGNVIKLTRKDSPDNQHHFIPTTWVAKVDTHVHLNKNSRDTEQDWKADATSCGCTDSCS